MRLLRVSRWLLPCLLLVTRAAAADESLKAAYAEILRGDYEAGRASVGRLLAGGGADEQVAQVNRWLDAFQHVVSSRDELRQKTFEWNTEQARSVLKQADELSAQDDQEEARKRVYLALSFAAQAAAYTADEQRYAAEPWIQALRARALAAAEAYAQSERWTKAHAFYMLLQRIDEKDEEVKSLRERAARHARLELTYANEEDLQRRIGGVNKDMLVHSIMLVADNYYEEPDFRKMAEGALDNLEALCTTTKLYKGDEAAGDFDGVANATTREFFLGQLEQERRKLRGQSSVGSKDLIRLYNTVADLNDKSVSLPEGLLIVEFMEGALGELDDFTSIVWPVDASEFDKMMIGNFVGVGIQLGVDELTNRLKVVTPLEDSPALEAGIQPDDLIVKVDGVSTKGWTTDKAVREITGPEGTKVTLTMFRPSVGEAIDFPLTRRSIKLTTIRGVERLDGGRSDEGWDFMLDREAGIAYIRLTNFNPDSPEELRKALIAARAQGMRGLILDLRHNPGGLLNVAVDTVSAFAPEGKVVTTKGQSEPVETHTVDGKAEFADLPLVVLDNEHSASASEILAGALRDHQRAVVVGERTFGKGSVQRVYSLRRSSLFGYAPSKARLKLTTALYYLPGGETPHKLPGAKKWGVDPNWKVELTPKEFSKVLERQRDAFIIHNEQQAEKSVDEEARESGLAALKADEEEDGEEDLLSEADIELLRSDPYEAPDVDPQLETALLHLRVRLAANLPWPQLLAKSTDEDTP
jgi:carboxyl-terminal processing protease